MIPDSTLPSNPDQIISLRESTVKDVIDFSDFTADHEEEATSMFLNRMQPKETRLDAKLWTAEDRRTLLFWYWIHSTADPTIALSYDCDFCGKSHTFLQDMREIGQGYQSLKDKPEREIRSGFIVKPLSGTDMEYLERGRLSLKQFGDEHGKESGPYRKRDAQVKLLRLLLCLHAENEPPEENRRVDAMEKRVLAMTTTEFGEMAEQVQAALDEMRHGLDTTIDEHGQIYLFTPPHKCPNVEGKESETRLRVPFRNYDYIPKL